MTLGPIISGFGALWWIAAIATFIASFFGAVLQPSIQRKRATNVEAPPVSLVLPVKLVNPGFEKAQVTSFDQDYPEYEVIVGAMESDSPALTIMRTMVDSSRVPAKIVRATAGNAVSPKLDTLAGPIDAAAYDMVVTKDSNISFAPDSLRAMLQSFVPGVGLVCAIPVSVCAESFAGQIEAILVNRDARMLLTASAWGKGYGVGKVMVFRRSDLLRAGGVAAIGYTIAEDTALSRAMATIGLQTVFSDRTVDQEIGVRSLGDVYSRQARWAVIRRAEEPVTFVLEPIACPLPAALAAALASPLLGLGAVSAFTATLLGWYLIEILGTAIKRWELAPWTPLAFIGRDLVLLTAWSRAWTTREVTWAGRKQNVCDTMRKPAR